MPGGHSRRLEFSSVLDHLSESHLGALGATSVLTVVLTVWKNIRGLLSQTGKLAYSILGFDTSSKSASFYYLLLQSLNCHLGCYPLALS